MIGDALVLFRALVFYTSSRPIWALLIVIWGAAMGTSSILEFTQKPD